jgi:transcriptional regulator GlxA family with amidase domain
MQTTEIAVIVFDKISPFHLSIPWVVFGEDRRDTGMSPCKIQFCKIEPGALVTSAGFTLTGLSDIQGLEQAGIIIVPSWRNPHEPPPEQLLKALREAGQRGVIIVGLCLGSYVLAAAGLLDGRKATTHWMWTEDLASRYPLVQVERDVLYVDAGQIITSAGVAAGIDCCLHLLRRLYGAEIANRVARRMVVPPHRQGGQAQYIDQPLNKSGKVDRFAILLEWLQTNLEQPHTLDALAERVFMSRRTFTRRFRQATGATVGAWLLHQRLALARRLLETTSESIDWIASEAGFGSGLNLRQQFRKELKTTPSRYRKEFST